jgi:ankyrin repeat protein
VQIHDEKGETLLHYAASDGDVSLTKALIEHGADVNLKPLTMICLWNNSRSEAANREVADLLLAHGANLKMVEENGLSLLHLAAIIDVASAVRYLLKRGIDVNIRDGFGRTPLHLAAMKGNTKIIECLLDYGADPNAKDGDGRTPEEAGSVSRTQLAAFYSATIAKRIVERKGG